MKKLYLDIHWLQVNMQTAKNQTFPEKLEHGKFSWQSHYRPWGINSEWFLDLTPKDD